MKTRYTMYPKYGTEPLLLLNHGLHQKLKNHEGKQECKQKPLSLILVLRME